ncbi:MAG TPA: PHB accumulation regulatory domain-containing protein, partial [Allosphingosinicella sp.]|nr:PHB accumulation regulatory domain-containing protein [Allosphingosinicella sp.]
GQMQSMLPQYLEASLDAFQQGQSQMRDALAGAFTANPFAELARRNMEMFQSAAGGGRSPSPPPPSGNAGREEELERLRAELAALQAKVEKLTK